MLYRSGEATLRRWAAGLAAALRAAREAGAIGDVTVAVGDCSPQPLVPGTRAAVDTVLAAAGLPAAQYRHFGDNLGHGGGHNRLFAEAAGDDYLLVLNPDTCAAAGLVVDLAGAMSDPAVGLVDARQLPLEHPKAHDPATGDTSWASGACALARAAAFAGVGGFDSDTFFLHGDDVDLSWRIRVAGWRVRHCSSARVFHDKRLDASGHVLTGPVEMYHSALGHLLLWWKYGRPDLVTAALETWPADPDQAVREAAGAFVRRRDAGELPDPLAGGALEAACFVDGEFAPSRFGPVAPGPTRPPPSGGRATRA